MRHTLTPEVIYEAVAQSFNTTVDLINSKSRRREAVEPRSVCIWLMRTRGAMKLPAIMEQTGYSKREASRCLEHVRELLRVDHDFYTRVAIADLLLIQQNFKINDLPALTIGVAAAGTPRSAKLFL